MRTRHKGAIALMVSIVVIISTIAYLLNEPPPPPPPPPRARGVFEATDLMTGELAPETTLCEIYILDGDGLTLQETVYNGAEMVMGYYAGEDLYLKIWDHTHSNICPRFMVFTVPQQKFHLSSVAIYPVFFDIEVDIVTMPDLWHLSAKGNMGQDIVTNYSILPGQYVELWFGIENPTNNTGFMSSYDFLSGYEYGALFYIAVNTSYFAALSFEFRPFYDGAYMNGFYPLSDDCLSDSFSFGLEADLWVPGIYEFHYGLLWGVDYNEYMETGSWGHAGHEFSHGFFLEVQE